MTGQFDASLWSRIGFMQGRLSPMVDGRIQAFPWPYWREEFAVARRHGFTLMEWTLDAERFESNPLMTAAGRREIRSRSADYGVRIPSVTGDFFMQEPFFKREGARRRVLLDRLERVVEACAELGIIHVVLPLVDAGRLENAEQESTLREGLEGLMPVLRKQGLRLLFESDFDPPRLARFVQTFDSSLFGINYDIGNSAAMGFDPVEEISAYGDRVLNVHVKDRVIGGGTVPLGDGSADFRAVFRALGKAGYSGNFILQTARASDGRHAAALCAYRDAVARWLGEIT